MKVFSLIRRAPMQVAAFTLAMLALIVLPINSALAAQVVMEGSMGVANQTAGETKYKETTNAKYDEVVKFQIFYHNRELPQSGRVAEDFKIKVNMPQDAGKNQVVSVTMKGSNTNTITDKVTVKLDRADARLEFIPGSVYWKHNVGTRKNINLKTEKIADNIILEGKKIENVKPCHEFEATVTFMARVKVDSVSITKKVRNAGNGQAQVQLAAQPNARLEYLITLKNLGNTNLTNVKVRDAMPTGMVHVPGTVKLFNGPNPNGVVINDNTLFQGGVNVGSIGPGATVFVTFEATVPAMDKLACGLNNLKNIAVVDTDQTGEYNNVAMVTVTKECAVATPVYACEALTVAAGANRTVKVTDLKYVAKDGATFKHVSYNFGDGSAPVLTNKTKDVSHTYKQDGTYTITATLSFDVKGEVKTATCEQKVNYQKGEVVPEEETTPEELPNTGAGEVIAIALAVTAAGAISHRVFAGRRG